MESIHSQSRMRPRLLNDRNVVDYDVSPLSTVGAENPTILPYPELKSSSDTHLAALCNFPNSISPTGLVYLGDTILDRGSQLHPLDL